jgi:hypothetical protein
MVEVQEGDLLQKEAIVLHSTTQPGNIVERFLGGKYFLIANDSNITIHVFVQPDGNDTVLTTLNPAIKAGATQVGVNFKAIWEFVAEKNVQWFLVHPNSPFPKPVEMYSDESFLSVAIMKDGVYKWICKRELVRRKTKKSFDQNDVNQAQ